MYLYLYINKDQRTKTEFKVHNHINSEMQARRASRDTSRDKQVCALKKIRLSFFRIYIVVNIFVPSFYASDSLTLSKDTSIQPGIQYYDISIFMPVLFRNRHLLNKKTLKQAERCTRDIV